MLIIPISHESQTVKRYPWVTLGLMVACLLAHVWVASQAPSKARDPIKGIQDAQNFFADHPHLDLSPEAEKVIFPGFDEETREAVLEMYRQGRRPARNSIVRKKHQKEFDALVERARTIMRGPLDDLYRRWGLVPASPSAVGFLTHMFLHGGLFHLLGNMLLLYLTGPFIEDAWGRGLYVGFYLASGLIAAQTFILYAPGLDMPLIGASGAIAGLMGAFLIRYWRTRIRFFYLLGFFFHGTFTAPAWLMLPLWLVSQLFMASLIDSSIKGGVAYWAHIGGFGFGALVAGLVKWCGIEERFLRPALGPGVNEPVVANKAVEQAMDVLAAGARDKAVGMLEAESKLDPANTDVALAFWNVSLDQGRAGEAAPALLRVIQQELRSGQEELAVEHWLELTDQVPGVTADPMLCVRLARALSGSGNEQQAAAALRLALLEKGVGIPASTALRIAREAMNLDPQVAIGAVLLALSRPDITQEERAAAEQLLRQLRPQTAAPVPVG